MARIAQTQFRPNPLAGLGTDIAEILLEARRLRSEKEKEEKQQEREDEQRDEDRANVQADNLGAFTEGLRDSGLSVEDMITRILTMDPEAFERRFGTTPEEHIARIKGAQPLPVGPGEKKPPSATPLPEPSRPTTAAQRARERAERQDIAATTEAEVGAAHAAKEAEQLEEGRRIDIERGDIALEADTLDLNKTRTIFRGKMKSGTIRASDPLTGEVTTQRLTDNQLDELLEDPESPLWSRIDPPNALMAEAEELHRLDPGTWPTLEDAISHVVRKEMLPVEIAKLGLLEKEDKLEANVKSLAILDLEAERLRLLNRAAKATLTGAGGLEPSEERLRDNKLGEELLAGHAWMTGVVGAGGFSINTRKDGTHYLGGKGSVSFVGDKPSDLKEAIPIEFVIALIDPLNPKEGLRAIAEIEHQLGKAVFGDLHDIGTTAYTERVIAAYESVTGRTIEQLSIAGKAGEEPRVISRDALIAGATVWQERIGIARKNARKMVDPTQLRSPLSGLPFREGDPVSPEDVRFGDPAADPEESAFLEFFETTLDEIKEQHGIVDDDFN